jgi:hypothetical protein
VAAADADAVEDSADGTVADTVVEFLDATMQLPQASAKAAASAGGGSAEGDTPHDAVRAVEVMLRGAVCAARKTLPCDAGLVLRDALRVAGPDDDGERHATFGLRLPMSVDDAHAAADRLAATHNPARLPGSPEHEQRKQRLRVALGKLGVPAEQERDE